MGKLFPGKPPQKSRTKTLQKRHKNSQRVPQFHDVSSTQPQNTAEGEEVGKPPHKVFAFFVKDGVTHIDQVLGIPCNCGDPKYSSLCSG